MKCRTLLSIIRNLCVFMALSLLVVACGDESGEEPNDEEPICEIDCYDGERGCDGDTIQICHHVGECPTWEDLTDCDAGETCDAGECVDACEVDCEIGAAQCADNGIQYCVSAAGCPAWSEPTDCPDETACDDGACVGDCVDQCEEEGDRRCSGSDGFQTCEMTSEGCLDWSDIDECEGELFCSGGECVDECDDVCTEGDTECDGTSGVRVCEQQASGCTDWSPDTTCESHQVCDDGACVDACDDACEDGDVQCDGEEQFQVCQMQSDGCYDWTSPINCSGDLVCLGGECIDESDELCSPDNPDGDCPDEQVCDQGECISEACSAENPDGECPAGEVCDGGQCVDDPICDCSGDEVCIDGQCYTEDESCSPDNPTGLCESGYDCIEGQCISSDDECSDTNPDGICPVGQWCDDGTCEAIEGEPLCDDGNPCTESWYNYNSNMCESQPADNECSDGNGCTTNWCEDGECHSDPIDNCIEPPEIDPYTTPTDHGEVELSGTKPAGSAIEINGSTAVDENPDTDWVVGPLTLDPGENVFEIRSVDGSTESEIKEVVIVYDNTPPTTTVTPEGGTFLNGITVQVTTDEPATVYYTTDGSEPDASSKSFQSVRQFRIFEPTELRFIARDVAGNWEEEVVEARFDITSAGNEWSVGSPLPEALIHAGVAQMDGVVYVAGGSSGTSSQAGAYAYDLEDGEWSTLPSLDDGRAELAMAVADGALYTIGGEDGGDVRATVSRWAPGDEEWEGRSIMLTARRGMAAVAWGDEIYTFGGKSSGGTVRDVVEVYDSNGDSWHSDVTEMPRERYDFDALVVGEFIYLVGGEDDDGEPVAEVDIYDPTDDTWTQGAPMPTPRSAAGAGVMGNHGGFVGSAERNIVVAGGVIADGSATTVVEEYRPADDTWKTRTPLDETRHFSSSVSLSAPDEVMTQRRQIWLVGGELAEGPTDSIAVYEHEMGFSRHLASMPEGRFEHAAAALNDRIYVFGGRHEGDKQTGWAFNPENGVYTDLPELPEVKNGLSAAGIDGRVFALGGTDELNNASSSVYAFDPVSWGWEEQSSELSPRRDAATVTYGDDIYVIGGDNNGAMQSVEIYTPKDELWRSGPPLPEARKGAMAVVHSGDIYVLGGVDSGDDPVTSILRLSEGDSSWEGVSGVQLDASYASAVQLGEDVIAVVGGRTADGVTGRIWFYDIEAGQDSVWRPVEATDRSASVYHHGRFYIFGGNADGGTAGETTVQKLDLHGCATGTVSLFDATWCQYQDLLVTDYASSTWSASGWNWTGYRFEVNREIMVTALYGGGTGAFPVGLYEADGNRPTALLSSVVAPAYQRRARMFSEPVVLKPGVQYIIAQGRYDDGGSHYRLSSIWGSIADHPVIADWNPADPSGALVWSASSVGPEEILDMAPSTTTTRPDMGFDYH